MLLFFDVETTGLPDFDKRASDPSQPHLVQLAAIMTDDTGRENEVHKILVQPDGWEIPKEASDVHGITTEFAKQYGHPERVVTSIIFGMLERASLSVAHNHQFDKFLTRIAARRHGFLTDERDAWWKALPTFCTMKAMTEVCQLPGTRRGFKWPKLQEAYEHAFGKQFDGAHDALADVRACKEIYFWLKMKEAVCA